MHQIKTRYNAFIAQLRNSRPQPLPVTDAAAEALIKAVIESCGLDPANDSLRQAVATMLLQMPQGRTKISVNELRDTVNLARTKQAAYSIIEDIRKKDKKDDENTQ